MKTFRVYEHNIFGFKAVKQGFIWPAAVFWWMWLLSERLYTKALAYFLAHYGIILVGINEAPPSHLETIAIILTLAYSYRIGSKASEWSNNALRKRGFILVHEVDANTKDQAIHKILG